MSQTVTRGQKTDLTKNRPGLGEVIVALGWSAGAGAMEIDAAAFMLQSNGRSQSDEDFIFYGNPKGRSGAVTIQSAQTPDKAQIKVNLPAVPTDVARIAFTLTIYDSPQKGHTFGRVNDAYLRVTDNRGQELIRFNLEKWFTAETAIVVAELYRHQGEWKLNPVAMGYHGGLAALCGGFGIEVADQSAPPPQKPVNQPRPGGTSGSTATQPRTAGPSKQTGPKINLSKIELKKKGDRINLEKKANNQLGEILVNLNWHQGQRQQPKQTGFLGSLFGGGGGKGGIDLDLGCLIEMKSGQKGVIQALGNSFGSYHDFPYIALDGDDRTGTVAGGENLRINGDRVSEFKRILIFAYIYEGVANWAQANGVVTIKQPGGPDIEVRMDEHDQRKIMCAIALIENVNNETFSVERLVRYFAGHREMDGAYNWGLRWQAGRKD